MSKLSYEEKIEIDEALKKKINNLLKFNNIKAKLEIGSIITLINTNIAYIEPHKLEINGNTYLLFNECDYVYINDLCKSIPLRELENLIECTI